MRFGLLLVLMLALAVGSVSAPMISLPVLGMSVTNCGAVAQGPFDCGSRVRFTCQVNSSAVYVNTVTFVFSHGSESVSVDGEKVYGFSANSSGLWGVNVTVDEYPWYLETVQVGDSSGNRCGSNDWISSSLCKVTFNDSSRNATGTCVAQKCEWTNSSVCSSDGVLTLTYTPNAYCGDALPYNLTSTCEYCTPNWTRVGTACAVNYSNANPFEGQTYIKWVDANGCYAKTGLLKDNTPPAGDDFNESCVLDYWLSDGRDSTSGYYNANSPYSAPELSKWTAEGNMGGTAYNARKPLVFDVDRDGFTEIAALFNGVWRIYDYDMNLKYSVSVVTSNGTSTFARGQPSLAGVSAWNDGSAFWFDSALFGSYGPALVSIAFDGSQYWFNSVQWTGSNFTQRASVSLGSWNVTSGLTCYKEYCYFITDSNVIVAADWSDGSMLNTNPNAPNTVYTTFTSRDSRVPVVAQSTSDTPSRVLVLGQSAANTSALFNCDLTLSSCNKFVIGNFTMDEMSRLSVVGPSANGTYYVAFTTTQLLVS